MCVFGYEVLNKPEEMNDHYLKQQKINSIFSIFLSILTHTDPDHMLILDVNRLCENKTTAVNSNKF